MAKKKVAVLLAEGFEEIEAVTNIDILKRAGLQVTIVGVGGSIIKGAHEVALKVDIEISNYKDLPDALMLPGGMPGVQNLSGSKDVNKLIKECNKKGKLIAAICAAPSHVLLPTGIIQGKKVTCYPGCEDLLKGKATFVEEKVCVDGNIITSRGPGTAFDFALKIVEILLGEDIKKEIKEKTLYEPSPSKVEEELKRKEEPGEPSPSKAEEELKRKEELGEG